MKKVAISQSNYIPWKGYFDLISTVDIFVIYDIVQYTKDDWRNRNKIITYNGVKWVTIPTEKKDCLNKKINEIKISKRDWYVNHLNQIKESYRKAPFYEEVINWLENIYFECKEYIYLSQVNKHFILAINEVLEIVTKIIDSENFEVGNERNQRLIDICLALDATNYVSGPAAKKYLDEYLFNSNGLVVEWMNYEGYPKYPQLSDAFEPAVSIIDLLFNVGLKEAKFYIKKAF
ncbi:WbqC family protein [Bacillus ndiopicus]|uniref:WbqC family protein n=1 Tax=Bacillus ndiopicus TaxID=1347368 RepID=UPI0005A8E861|nr:WbqC family protein [Bacillus ndiopicus]